MYHFSPQFGRAHDDSDLHKMMQNLLDVMPEVKMMNNIYDVLVTKLKNVNMSFTNWELINNYNVLTVSTTFNYTIEISLTHPYVKTIDKIFDNNFTYFCVKSPKFADKVIKVKLDKLIDTLNNVHNILMYN